MRISTLLLLSFLLFPSFAQATIKMAFVDMQKAMYAVEDGQQAKRFLLKKKSLYEKKLERVRQRLARMQKRLKKRVLILRGRRRQQALEQLQQQFVKFRQQQARLTRKLALEESRLMHEIVDKMQVVLSGIIRDNQITVMLDKKANHVLYIPADMDYTNELIRRYNRAYRHKRKLARKHRRGSRRSRN